MESLRAQRLADQDGHTLFFSLVDVVHSASGHNSSLKNLNLMTDVVHILASKMLYTFLFIAMEWSSSDVQPPKVFHLPHRILKGKALPSSLIVAQASVDLPTTEDLEEVARKRARHAGEAIASSDAHASNG